MVPFVMLSTLQLGDFHWDADDIQNRWFDELCEE
jgi:hypothetical protein